MAGATSRVVLILAVTCLLLAGWLLIMPYVGTNAEPPGKSKGGSAADHPAADLPKPAPFDGARAFGYLKELCAIGPRISGSPGMKKQQELLEAHFKKLGAQITWQRFATKHRTQPNAINLANMIVTWHPEQKRRVLICSHYDTRPKADQEDNPREWDRPFVSANDGTGGAAFLMELGQ